VYERVVSSLDEVTLEALGVYQFVHDQTQYLGMEGTPGPLPLTAIKAGLEILEVDHALWTAIIERIRILHTEWCKFHAPKRGKAAREESPPSAMMQFPFAKKVPVNNG
jgi:hypothetical protein